MKIYQPFAVTGFCFCISLVITSLLPFDKALLLVPMVFAVFLGLLIFFIVKGFNFNHTVILISAFLMAVAVALNLGYRYNLVKTAVYFPKTETEITGKVIEEVSSGGIIVKTEKTKMLLYPQNNKLPEKGETFLGTVRVYENIPSRSQTGKGAMIVGQMDGKYRIIKEAGIITKFIKNVKVNFERKIKTAISSPYDSLLIAMLLGDTGEMHSAIYDKFNLTGISHILCVSGLHITLIGSILTGFLNLIFGKRKFCDIAAIAGMLFFVLLTGAQPSAIRAFVMAVALILSRHTVRNYSPLNTLGFVVLLFCISEPYIVYNTGFLMSVFAVFALCVAAGEWSAKIIEIIPFKHRALSYCVNLFTASATVSVFLIPIMLIGNKYTSLISPFANLIIVPLVPVVMVLGCVSALTGLSFISTVTEAVINFMIFIAHKVRSLPFAILPLNNESVKITLVAVLLIVVTAFVLKVLKSHSLKILSVCVVLFIISTAVYRLTDKNTLNVVSLESGKGVSTVIYKNNDAVIVNCGGNDAIGSKTAQYMRSVGIRNFELLITTEEKSDKNSGVANLTRLITPKEILKSDEVTRNTLGGVLYKTREGVKLNVNNREIFLRTDNTLGLLQNGEEIILRKGKKEDTLKPKYDIIDLKVIKIFEKDNFIALNSGEKMKLKISGDGKMMLKEG